MSAPRRDPTSQAAARIGMLVMFALCGCGPTRLEQLLESVRSEEIDRQRIALREIADLGSEAAPAIPDLLKLSDHPHPDVRRLSGLALGNLASGHSDSSSNIAARHGDILDVLTRQLDDPDLAVRNTAAFALLDLNPEHASAQRRLRSAMQQGDGGIIDRLSHVDPKPVWAVPTLINILNKDRKPGMRRLSAVALGKIDPGRDDVQQALKAALNDRDEEVRSAADAALRHVPS